MNILENYLVEVIKIEPCNDDWTKEKWAKDKEYIWATATFNCYGRKETHRRVYSKEEWQGIVNRGYYMG
ncbi:hypothetical protein [Clostridium sporogenes]|uniref:hypothetical protein n=1 Tax=Clostridium sporogenes TaxID=1509 RepID=UPI0006B282F6|nr:hypothetical protein [Clostridium sporogenes]KOY65501.1 hypothetical protein AN649_13595 [Clostridium sporogenes]MDS1006555.1 hypothetical protein [Clostridium sporogenes]